MTPGTRSTLTRKAAIVTAIALLLAAGILAAALPATQSTPRPKVTSR